MPECDSEIITHFCFEPKSGKFLKILQKLNYELFVDEILSEELFGTQSCFNFVQSGFLVWVTLSCF